MYEISAKLDYGKCGHKKQTKKVVKTAPSQDNDIIPSFAIIMHNIPISASLISARSLELIELSSLRLAIFPNRFRVSTVIFLKTAIQQ